MRLYDAQIAQIAEFDERGYLFFPGLLEADEAQILQDEMPDLLARQGPEVMRERGEECAARLVFGAYQFSEAFRLLTQLPRMLLPVRQLLRDQVYLHQSRLNPQEGFGKGGQWEWHQDFGPWHRLDDMSEPRCIMAAVFVDDCSVAQSPLMVVPGTHRLGYLESIQPDTDAGGAAVYNLDRRVFEEVVGERGIEPLIGDAGSVAFIHCNLIHGSANNVSPWRRGIMYLNYNAVSNACTDHSRAWCQCNRDVTPLEPVEDEALRNWLLPRCRQHSRRRPGRAEGWRRC